MKKVMSIHETAAAFGVGRNTLYHLCKVDPTFPAIRIGSRIKVNTTLFEEWLDKATKEGRKL